MINLTPRLGSDGNFSD